MQEENLSLQKKRAVKVMSNSIRPSIRKLYWISSVNSYSMWAYILQRTLCYQWPLCPLWLLSWWLCNISSLLLGLICRSILFYFLIALCFDLSSVFDIFCLCSIWCTVLQPREPQLWTAFPMCAYMTEHVCSVWRHYGISFCQTIFFSEGLVSKYSFIWIWLDLASWKFGIVCHEWDDLFKSNE